MKTIKLRCWHKSGQMFTDVGIDRKGRVEYADDQWFMPGEVTVMQATGLKDRHGKEIYEGDIVLVKEEGETDFNDKPSVVEYGKYDFPGFEIYPNHHDEAHNLHWYHEVGEIKVIGNIYENHELISQND